MALRLTEGVAVHHEVGDCWYFTRAFLRSAYGVVVREGEFDFGPQTWRALRWDDEKVLAERIR